MTKLAPCQQCQAPALLALCWCLRRLCQECRLGAKHTACIERHFQARLAESKVDKKAVKTNRASVVTGETNWLRHRIKGAKR